jgi:hypothetical protein
VLAPPPEKHVLFQKRMVTLRVTFDRRASRYISILYWTPFHIYCKELSMKTWLAVLLVGALASVLLVGHGVAQDKKKDKEVSLKGKVTCAKCDLGLEKQCTTVIVVKESGKDVVYYFDTKADKSYHSAICSEAKEGEVIGVVSEKDGKKIVTVDKVNYKK